MVQRVEVAAPPFIAGVIYGLCRLRSGAPSTVWIKSTTILVRIPHYSKKELTDHVDNRLKQIFEEIAAELGFEILPLEIPGDHVHVFVSAPLHRTQFSAVDEKVCPPVKSVLGTTRHALSRKLLRWYRRAHQFRNYQEVY